MGTLEEKLRKYSHQTKKERIEEYRKSFKVNIEGCNMGYKDLKGRDDKPLSRPARGKEASRACERQIEEKVGKGTKVYNMDGNMYMRWCLLALTFPKAGCSSKDKETAAACRCAYSIRKNIKSMAQRSAYEHSCTEEFDMRLHPDGFEKAKACLRKQLATGSAGFANMMKDWATHTCKPLASQGAE